MIRNPYRGLNPLKEFLYDARHPGQFFTQDFMPGLRGENPRVTKGQAYIGLAVAVVGLGNFLVGLVAVLTHRG